MKGRSLLALSVVAIALACKDQTPTEPAAAKAPTDPSEIISDGAHGGNPDFFFLPPMVPLPLRNPNFELGKFNNTLRPSLTIEICELLAQNLNPQGRPTNATGCVGADRFGELGSGGVPLKTFAPGTVKLVNLPLRENGWWNWFNLPPDGFYYVLWDTRQSNLNVNKYYRIKVFINGSRVPLGIADVDPMANLFQWKYTLTGEVVQLIDDVLLPIPFRVENGGGPALCSGALCTSTIVTNDNPNGDYTVLPVQGNNGPVAGAVFPDGWLPVGPGLPTSVVVTISSVNTGVNDVAAGTQSIPCHANLPLQQFNGCFKFTTTPALAPVAEGGHQFARAVTVVACFVLQDTEDPREPFVQLWSSGPNEPAHPLVSVSSALVLTAPTEADCGSNFETIIGSNSRSNPVTQLASAGWAKMKRGFGRVFSVKTAYAVDVGLGGLTFDFSNVGPALTAQIQRYTDTELTLGPGATTTSTARIIGTRTHNGSALSTGIGGLPVTFTVAPGNGTLRLIGSEAPPATVLTSITNTNPIDPGSPTSGGGFAPVNWTLPTVPGTYTLTATGPATGGPITFTATVPALDGLTALTGSWANENPATGGNTRVRIAVDGSSVSVHAWGACSPTECDWGPTNADLSRWASDDEITAVWDQGFVISTQTITQLSATRLQIVNHYDFIPPDTRTDFTSPAEFFTKASVVDQSHSLAPAGLTALINECCRYIAQTFTAGVTGSLVGVNVEVWTEQTAYPLNVALRTVSGGVPTSTILGERTLATSLSNLSQLVTFSEPIILTAGVQYAIVVSYPTAPPAGGGQSQGQWGGTTGDMYSGGRFLLTFDGLSWFESGPGNDVYFRTHMSVSTP